MAIREGLPLLAKHEGEWEGTYTHVDATGKIIDRHASHLSCLLPPEDPDRYLQINRYRWEDGRTEEYAFPGVYDGHGRLYFDTERIKGVTWRSTRTRCSSPGGSRRPIPRSTSGCSR